MENQLSWNPTKWKSYSLDGSLFKVKLETGEVYEGILNSSCIIMKPGHFGVCYKIFGQDFTSAYPANVSKLSQVLDLDLKPGNWPEYSDVKEFLKRYYERVAKIGNSNISNISKICIETEFDITPKFTI